MLPLPLPPPPLLLLLVLVVVVVVVSVSMAVVVAVVVVAPRGNCVFGKCFNLRRSFNSLDLDPQSPQPQNRIEQPYGEESSIHLAPGQMFLLTDRYVKYGPYTRNNLEPWEPSELFDRPSAGQKSLTALGTPGYKATRIPVSRNSLGVIAYDPSKW